MASPRILIVGNFLSSHGASRGVCEELTPRLREAGFPVIMTSNRKGRFVRLADMLATVWSRRNDYDVAQVDVYSGPAFFWAEAACGLLRRLGRPYILTLHGGSLPDFARASRQRVEKLLKSAAAVTAPSGYLFTQMSEYRCDLLLLPNALDLKAYTQEIRQPLQPKLIWLRSFHHVYNPSMAPRVLSHLTEEFPSIHLTMAGADKGDGSREGTVECAKNLGVMSHLDVRGPMPKGRVPEFLATGDIFLNTTHVDNTPVTVMEALASAMCVVSTDVGGIPYLVKSGEESLLVPANDDKAMAEAVRQILSDASLSERMQRAAIAKARTLDWGVILPQWSALISSVAKSNLISGCETAMPNLSRLT